MKKKLSVLLMVFAFAIGIVSFTVERAEAYDSQLLLVGWIREYNYKISSEPYDYGHLYYEYSFNNGYTHEDHWEKISNWQQEILGIKRYQITRTYSFY
jgi:hypothetical protein